MKRQVVYGLLFVMLGITKSALQIYHHLNSTSLGSTVTEVTLSPTAPSQSLVAQVVYGVNDHGLAGPVQVLDQPIQVNQPEAVLVSDGQVHLRYGDAILAMPAADFNYQGVLIVKFWNGQIVMTSTATADRIVDQLISLNLLLLSDDLATHSVHPHIYEGGTEPVVRTYYYCSDLTRDHCVFGPWTGRVAGSSLVTVDGEPFWQVPGAQAGASDAGCPIYIPISWEEVESFGLIEAPSLQGKTCR